MHDLDAPSVSYRIQRQLNEELAQIFSQFDDNFASIDMSELTNDEVNSICTDKPNASKKTQQGSVIYML